MKGDLSSDRYSGRVIAVVKVRESESSTLAREKFVQTSSRQDWKKWKDPAGK